MQQGIFCCEGTKRLSPGMLKSYYTLHFLLYLIVLHLITECNRGTPITLLLHVLGLFACF